MPKLRGLGLLLGLLILAGCMFVGPTGPVILYEENFNSDTNWHQGENDSSRWWIEGGKYHVLVKTEDMRIISWNGSVGQLGNFQLDVDAEQISGPDDNGYGIQFRMVDGDNFYRFRISGDGYAKFDKKVAGSYIDIRGWESTSLIHEGNAVNHITILANGSTFTFLINGTQLYAETDTSFVSGALGFIAVLLDFPAPAEFAFDNLIVTELE